MRSDRAVAPIGSPHSSLAEPTLDQVRSLIDVLLRGEDVRNITRVDGGFINRIFRIELAGWQAPLALRIYTGGADAFEKERRVLAAVAPALPAPEVVFAGVGDHELPHPYILYRWIDGMHLNDCRRNAPASALLGLAGPLGQLAAGVAAFSLGDILAPIPSIEQALARAEEQLRDGLARDRLGGALADALRARLDAAAHQLTDAERAGGLVHGDFGGRNIIVAPADSGAWRVVGLIDWESAFTGSALWDVGSFFRYARRYSVDFRDRFASAYRAAGGTLPDDWYAAARLLDATRLVEMLSEERDLAAFFAELRDAIDLLVEREAA